MRHHHSGTVAVLGGIGKLLFGMLWYSGVFLALVVYYLARGLALLIVLACTLALAAHRAWRHHRALHTVTRRPIPQAHYSNRR